MFFQRFALLASVASRTAMAALSPGQTARSITDGSMGKAKKVSSTGLWVVLLFLGVSGAGTRAAEGPWEQYDKLIKKASTVAAHGTSLLGDQVSLQSGALSFRTTDVSLPGNNALPVEITRTFQTETRPGYQKNGPPRDVHVYDESFSDWDLELPFIGGVFATSTGWVNPTYGQGPKRCEVASPDAIGAPSVSQDGVSFLQYEIWNGTRISIPGRGSQALQLRTTTLPQPASGGAYWITGDWTSVSCLASVNTSNGGTGQGFIATTNDGVRYTFDWMAVTHESRLAKVFQTHNWGSRFRFLNRGRYALYATRVEDRFGNWVSYSYTNAANAPIKLARIESNDGRVITLTHSGNVITSATAHGRTWHYGYTGERLTSVTLPDTSQWQINLDGFKRLVLDYEDEEPQVRYRGCGDPGGLRPRSYMGTITHPSGATGIFLLDQRRIRRSGMPADNCVLGNINDQNDDTDIYPEAWDAYALSQKTLSGPGLANASWSYYYGSGTYDVTDVYGPGSFERHTFGNGFRTNEGKALMTMVGNGPADILSTTSFSYNLSLSGNPYHTRLGDSGQWRSDSFTEEYVRPMLAKTVAQQGVSFLWQVATGCAGSGVPCLDAYARPTKAASSMGAWHSRTDVTSYYDDTALWVLGQISAKWTNGVETERIDYWPASAKPQRTYAFGKARQHLAYDGLGNLSSVADGNNNVTSLSQWKRGIPQLIQHQATRDQPAGVSESASVNDSGWITSVVDENGYATGYGYDAMGRLSAVAYPANDLTAWNTETILFEPVGNDEHGLPAGHWRSIRSVGNKRAVVFYDALWRPVVEQTYDVGDIPNTISRVVKHYDIGGRLSFQSYPIRDLGNYWEITQGTHTSYDGLDRVVQVSQNSEHGLLTTTTQYVAPFQTVVTNPRGFKTTTGYYAYDEPTYDQPGWIVKEVGNGNDQTTQIERDAFGKPTTIRQSGYTDQVLVDRSRHYVYDAHQQLCKSIEPETGSTVMDYDPAGNLAWTATGHDLPDAGNCNTAQGYSWGRRVDRLYDGRNRLLELKFADGRGNQWWAYTPDGLPSSITTFNEPGHGVVANSYAYNKRRMLVGEGVSQPNQYGWGVGYGYDANGSLDNNQYPNGLVISYAPNAVGQPKAVTGSDGRTYASAVEYHPNGAIKGFTYGNGVVHSMTQNARQLPSTVTGSGNVMAYEYSYDQNANPTAILDWARGTTYHRWMYYDGLDRLTDAGSASFTGDHWHRLKYDAIDNIRSWTVGGGAKDYSNYVYDAKNRLTSIQNSAGATVVTLGYDAQGNLGNKDSKFYNFDMGNRLRSTNEEWYRYDGHGRRVQNWRATEPGTLSMYTQAGTLIYDQNERASGRKYSDYVYLAGSLIATRALNIDTHVRAVTYSHTDALGSPVAVTNEAGQVVDRTAYQPWGRPIAKPTYDGIGYTGHVRDGATQLTYMQQRYYDETIGRFLSVDPVTAYSMPGSNFNRYWYANNNPYRFTDPDGRWAEDAVLGVPSVVMGVRSFVSNVREGNIGGAVVDGLGVVADGIAIATPGIPGGAGAAIGIVRGVDKVADAGKAGKTAGYVGKDGKTYTNTKHGLDRAIGDGGSRAGTKPAAIRDALQNPKSVKSGTSADGKPFEVHKGKDARVVVNPETQKIISVNPTNRNGVR